MYGTETRFREILAVAKALKRKRKTLENKHRDLFPPMKTAPSYPQEWNPAPVDNTQYLVVNVTSYGGYEAPIEGWSILNAELGRGLK